MKKPGDYELARLLRTLPRKIRAIRDDLAYRDLEKDEEWCREHLAEILKNAERIKDGEYVAFQIDNGLLRDYAKKLVRNSGCVFESGMSGSVVKVSGKTFAALAMMLQVEKIRTRIISVVPEAIMQGVQDFTKPKGQVRLFVDSIVKAAGSQAGKIAVKFAFSLLTGNVLESIQTIAKLFQPTS